MFNKDSFFESIMKIITFITSIVVFLVILFIVKESIPFFKVISIKEFIFERNWNPIGENKKFGILAMILGSIYISLASVIIALPLGIGSSIFIVFSLKEKFRKTLLAFIDILAGIPSVIFGFLGLSILVKIIEKNFNVSSGECLLAGSILLSIMILPFIISNCTESILKSKEKYENISLNLGVSKYFTIRKLIVPSIINAIFLSAVLSFSRSIGETMAVMMVIGNSPIIPNIFGKMETIPSLIALEMGSVEYSSLHYHSLYASALILLLVIFIFNIIFYLFKSKGER